MHIIGILSVKNESDFIERSIRFNKTNIDEFYIADDNSSDETVAIINFLKLEGIKINLFSVASKRWSIEQNQSAIGEQMLKIARTRGFDYAFLLDADELILGTRNNTEAELAKIGASGVGRIPWKTFIPVSKNCEHHDYPLIDAFRAVKEEPRQYWKAVIRHADSRGLHIRPGNHSVARNGIDLQSTEINIPLAHFPVRSADQFMAKIITGYHKRTMKPQLYQNEAYHQLLFFREIKNKNFQLSFDDLMSMALRYTGEAENVTLNPHPVKELESDIKLKFPIAKQGITSSLNGFMHELSQHYASSKQNDSGNAPTQGLIPVSASIAQCSFKNKTFLVSNHGKEDVIGQFLLEGKSWEPRVSEYIYRLANETPGVYFIDIGANIGYTTSIANICGAEKIIAFECSPDSFAKLKETISLNLFENVEMINTGLSNTNGEMDFQKVSGNIAASYIKNTHIGWTASEVQYAGKVSVSSFDTLNINISNAQKIVLKLDIEGHELQALQGMPKLLADRRLSNIIIEYNPETSLIQNMLATTSLLFEAGFGDIDLIFSARSDGWAGEEIKSPVKFEKISPKTIDQLLSCGVIFELGFNRISVH